MKNNLSKQGLTMVCATLLFASHAWTQEHRWAGRTLDDVEWSIHEAIASLPTYGVFDTINFEVQGKTVTLSGLVVGEKVKHRAERAISRLSSVERVINHIEVLPSSRRDDALRMNVYRAIYPKKDDPSRQTDPPIHIIVKNGWVTLEGVVDSDADRGRLSLQAMQVTAHLSDNLRVVPDQQ
jgi:hypothetical protein